MGQAFDSLAGFLRSLFWPRRFKAPATVALSVNFFAARDEMLILRCAQDDRSCQPHQNLSF